MLYDDYEGIFLQLEVVKELKPPLQGIKTIAKIAYESKKSLNLEHWAKEVRAIYGEHKTVEPSDVRPAVKLASEFLVREITPWVEWTREKFWNSKEVPFASSKEGFEWLRDLDDSAPPKISLTEQVINVAMATGFSEDAILEYTFTGKKPTIMEPDIWVGKKKYRLPDGRTLARPFVTMDIYCEPSLDEFRSLYVKLRQGLETTKVKSPTGKHLKLYQMVQSRGGVPEKNKVAFWKFIAKQFGYTRWFSAKITYGRILERLRSQYQIEGVMELGQMPPISSHKLFRDYLDEGDTQD